MKGYVPGGKQAAPAPAGQPTGAGTPPATSIPPPIPPGRYLILGAVPPSAGIIDKGKGGSASGIDWNRDHPVLRAVTLDKIAIAESRLVDAPKGGTAEVLANADNSPMMLEVTTADARAIV